MIHISVFRKQIQKKYLSNILSLFLLGILVSSGFFVFIHPVKAVSTSTYSTGTLSDESATGNCPTNKLPMWYKYEISKPVGPRGMIEVGTEDTVNVNMTIQPSLPAGTNTTQDIAWMNKIIENCMAKVAAGQIRLDLSIVRYGSGDVWHEDSKLAIKVDNTTFGVGFEPFKLPAKTALPDMFYFKFKLSTNGSFPNPDIEALSILGSLKDGKSGNDETITPIGNSGNGGGTSQERKLSDIKITTTVKDKYRVLLDEVAGFKDIKFSANGVPPINGNWASPANTLSLGQKFELPAASDYTGPSFTPVFYNMDFGINYSSKVNAKSFVGCEHNRFLSDTCKTAFFNSESGSSTSTLGAPSSIYESLPQTSIDPVIHNAAWADKTLWKNANANPSAGQPLGTVEFAVIPVIWGDTGVVTGYSRDLAVALNANPAKFTVEVYKTIDDIKKACEADANVTDKTICADPQKSRYAVGKDVTSTSSTTETGAATVAQSLYSFIVRVISNIIVWLQSVIFWVFATILVPILNALLKVHPYEDAFVNIIYPGWLILRNLANIFFIVSLLVVGLRILFQQSAAGAARSFILRLVLMALLVNFSLVIAQGLVGIADTVQSQFLPGNTRVIEALGQKLMVEPLKVFRAEVTNSTDNGLFSSSNAEVGLADTIKPLVFLMLSIASFFSFVALAAFLLVRLVALWVLYMLSPIAYVGFVMDETKSYASRWWSEFLKYAIVTPVLVFFLNMAALMASLFSGQDNSLFTAFSDGTLSQDIVTGALTIISHFIVLFFIYAGMKFALSSGTAGAKTIVDYSKKGYDALTTRPAKWAAGKVGDAKDFAKDAAKDSLKTQWDRRFKGGMLDPQAYRDAYKAKVDGKTKDMYAARMLRKANRLSPAGLVENPKQSMKYLFHKATFRGAQRKAKEADLLEDKSKKLTENERESLDNKYETESARLAPLEQISKKLNANNPLSVKEAKGLVTHLQKEGTRIQDHALDVAIELEKDAVSLSASGNEEAAEAKRNQAAGVQAEAKKRAEELVKIEKTLQERIDHAPDDDDATISLDDDLKVEISDKLDKDIEDLTSEIKNLSESIKEDDRRIKDYGPEEMTPIIRRDLQNQKHDLEKEIAKRSAPESSVVKQIRREREDNAKKKIEDTDDSDELIAQYNKALAKNNLPLASAIAKKLAAEGSFADLLKEKGYRNNVQDFQKFVTETFKDYAPQVRLQIMSEIGAINEKNGNRAASRATKIDTDTGVIRMASPAEHAAKHNGPLSKKPLSAAKTMKKNDFGEEGADGRLKLYTGAAKLLSQFKQIKKPKVTDADYTSKQVEYERKIRTWQQDWAPTANAILDATNSNLVDREAIEVLQDIAMKKP